MNKSLLIRSIVMGFIVGIALYAIVAPTTTHAEPNNTKNTAKSTLVYNGRLTICKLDRTAYETIRTIKKAVVTGYSSTVGQTDSTPYTPADGTDLRDLKEGEWAVATNILPLGTMVRLTVEEK